MSEKITVLVHGASGTQGASVVRRLLADGHSVVATMRNPDGASLPDGVKAVSSDLNDVDSLVRAYSDVGAVVVQLPLEFSPERAVPQAESVLQALKRAGVKRAVFNGNGPLAPAPVGVPYVDARVTLAQSLGDHVPHAAVVNPAGPYMENLAGAWQVAGIQRDRVIRYPIPPQAPVPWVALDDVAAVIAESLVAEEAGAVSVTGPEPLTGLQVAEHISAAVGFDVRWEPITPQEHARLTTPYLGEEAALGVASLYEARRNAPPVQPSGEIRSGTTRLSQWVTGQNWQSRVA
ncbi:SDR family oxidoreductase [Streptomyces sp. NPDC085932]|uniref:SDR family oxidoreductase n=1 Tax=Streptomyces sp. NPDC085932 TaxID=3365741 RepID=UPI0037CCDDDD